MDSTAEKKIKPSWYAWVVWLLGALFYFYEFLLQVSPNVMKPDLTEHFTITGTQFGYLATFYFVAYAAMQIPAGMLFDRFGARRLLTIATLICVAGTLVQAAAPNFAFVEISRFITGLGSAFALLGTLILAATWFPATRFAMLSGLILTVGMLGAVFGQTPLALMIEYLGWQPSLYILSGVGLVLAAIIWTVVYDNKNPMRRVSKPLTFRELMHNVRSILRSPQAWLVAIYGVLMYGPTATLGTSWGTTFLMTAYDLKLTTAANLVLLIYIGWAVGSPLFGALSDAMRLRKPTLYVSAIGGFICSFILVYVHLPSIWLVAIVMLLFGFISSAFMPSYSIARELQPVNASGAALGFMNMINNLGGAFIPPLIGYLLDKNWNGVIENNTRIYSMHDMHIAMSILPISMFLGIVFVFTIKETYGITAKKRINL